MESKENREDSDDSQSSEEVEDHSEKSESSPAKSHGKEITKAKPKGQSQKSSHPSTAEMVNNAIKELKERKGSSVQAIKKYIGTMYEVDVEKLTPFIKKYLKNAVTTGTLIQSSGKGASGSFKLPKTVSSMKKSQGKPNKLTQKKAMKSPGQKKKEAKIISPTKEVSPKKKSKAVSPKKRGQTVSPKKRGQTVSPTKKVVTVSSTKEASVSPKKPVKKKSPSKTETKSSPTKKSASKEKKGKSPKIKAKVPKPKKAAEAKPKTKIPSK